MSYVLIVSMGNHNALMSAEVLICSQCARVLDGFLWVVTLTDSVEDNDETVFRVIAMTL